ncbi:hypothetical protein K60_021030 [Mycobacterium tuberculosis variant bovis BCG str. Korea 1168P]|uniref:Uncharacterized protein n=1 Tax=Mycobacterium tuberculosis (strain CDC 1551 / Oshkosh) TaxID=83331 RepID=Q8VJR7_MYCTO|nr:hypothetical protein MT2083 [Mycobacterium tuberculosis CDC1551]AGE68013.1 hypothetical protein K60_021030 [Mycobacterium tuberculosis variant bovis BCG str. Korea 1168P]AHM07763.1 hypothetical protein BCGT_1843 [Mycobacterium tuberculosis variant bovis BCG str. ATCC 35743]AIB48678.1 hypothetical protein MTBK_21330 [Mycobacterium tuberculosis K]AKO25056.1 hypothetical protein GS11_2130 [Mycobacterium tuberculosis variant bovis BCG]AKR01793.1 hypothetical protein Mb1595_p2270 [Mycobacterium 
MLGDELAAQRGVLPSKEGAHETREASLCEGHLNLELAG